MYLGTQLLSKEGHLYEKSNVSVDCCTTNSILLNEDGSSHRWPSVGKDYKCGGGFKLNFDEWMQRSVGDGGICFNKSFYESKGTIQAVICNFF